MARGKVFIEEPEGIRLWKTDLTGHGPVRVGEEFTVREVSQYGSGGLVKGGKSRRVRVVSVESRGRSFDVLKVETIESSVDQQRELFG